MHGNATDGRLKQRELVRDEGVAVGEVGFVLEVAVAAGVVGKVEQGLEVVALLVVDALEQLLPIGVFAQQAFLDHFGHVGAGELESVGKAGLDLGKIVALLLAHVAQDVGHVLLRGDDDPCPATAFGGQAFGHGLQVGHELGVVGNVLPDLVDKKVQPKIGGLLVQPIIDLIGKVFDRQIELLAVLVEDAF